MKKTLGFVLAALLIASTAASQIGHIDSPNSNITGVMPVVGTRTIAGWAVTDRAVCGPHVDAVHLWAIPLNGDPAVFLGPAAVGLARPDIGVAFGSCFTNAGWSLTLAQGALATGAYQLYAYLHSDLTNTFVAALALAGPDGTWLNAVETYMRTQLDGAQVIGSGSQVWILPTGYAVKDALHRTGATGAEFLIDDWPGYQGAVAWYAIRAVACMFASCAPVGSDYGIYAYFAIAVGPGWHYVRAWATANVYDGAHEPPYEPSNAVWFYVD